MNNAEQFQNLKIGRRIHVTGNSCSGKSTVGSVLAAALDIPLVELDALNWEPGWVGMNETNPAELERRMQKATDGDGWVVAGSYTVFSQRVFWPRLETIVWLDLPVYQLLWRWFTRSWRRWRTKELLWGTNYESFWPQFLIWRGKDSLLYWIITQHLHKRRRMLEYQADLRWKHICFIRLRSDTEIKSFYRAVGLIKKIKPAGTG